MKIILRNIQRILFKILILLRLHTFLAFLYSMFMEELTDNGNLARPSKRADNNKLTILILSARAFRKDIDCIVNTNEFRLLRMSEPWQARLSSQFLYCSGNNQKYWAQSNFKYKKEWSFLQDFLYVFLKKLYEQIVVDCVISPHPRYVFDMEWGVVSTQLGVPHILISRDSQIASSPFLLNKMKHSFRSDIPKFEGKHIIVQSELDIPVYVESGYCRKREISSLGCPRMDSFVRKSEENKCESVNIRKKVVFMPFSWNWFFEKSDLFSYICEVHLFFVHFALRYPEIDVVIKAKPKQPSSQRKTVLLKPLEDSSVEIEKIPNLTIREDLYLNDLFFEADVVCGLNTSALLEAAVIGLPIIIPYFKALQCPKYEERVFYRDAYDLFDIAESLEDLESLILKRLQNPVIEKDIMEGRKALFEKFISSVKGDATEKYVTLIKEIVNKQNRNILVNR